MRFGTVDLCSNLIPGRLPAAGTTAGPGQSRPTLWRHLATRLGGARWPGWLRGWRRAAP